MMRNNNNNYSSIFNRSHTKSRFGGDNTTATNVVIPPTKLGGVDPPPYDAVSKPSDAPPPMFPESAETAGMSFAVGFLIFLLVLMIIVAIVYAIYYCGGYNNCGNGGNSYKKKTIHNVATLTNAYFSAATVPAPDWVSFCCKNSDCGAFYALVGTDARVAPVVPASMPNDLSGHLIKYDCSCESWTDEGVYVDPCAPAGSGHSYTGLLANPNVTIATLGEGFWMSAGGTSAPVVGAIAGLSPIMFIAPLTGTLSNVQLKVVGDAPLVLAGTNLVATAYTASAGGVAPAATAVTTTLVGGTSSATSVATLAVTKGQLLGFFVTFTGTTPEDDLSLSLSYTITAP